MARRAVEHERTIVTKDCGCEYMTGGSSRGPVVACEEHRYMRCGKCQGRAEITPFGLWCSHCTFGNEIIPWEEEEKSSI